MKEVAIQALRDEKLTFLINASDTFSERFNNETMNDEWKRPLKRQSISVRFPIDSHILLINHPASYVCKPVSRSINWSGSLSVHQPVGLSISQSTS